MVLGLAKCFCFGRGCAPLFRIAVEPPRRFIEFFSTGSHAAEESHHLGDFHGIERNMRENTNSESQKWHVYVFQKRSSSMKDNKTLKVKLADLSKCLEKGDLKQGVAVK